MGVSEEAIDGLALAGGIKRGRSLRLLSVTQWWLGPALCLCTAH